MAAKKKTEETPATPTELIRALISALGHDPAETAGIDISSKYARVWGKDRSLRSHSIGTDWNAKEAEDA